MRELDRQTYTALGISEYELMCEAGRAAFHVLASHWPEARHILVYAAPAITVVMAGFWRDWPMALVINAGSRYSGTLPVSPV